MKSWWQNLAKRERYTLIIGGIVTIIILFYQFIYRPYTENLHRLQNDINNQQELVIWMQDAEKKIKKLQSGSQTSQGLGQKSLLTATADSLSQAKIKPSNIGQAANDRVSVRFDTVDFNDLMVWLINIWKNYGVEVYSANMSAKDVAGVIEASLVLDVRKEG